MRDMALPIELLRERRKSAADELSEPFSVLVVDDDPNYRAWITRLIDRMQMHVVEAGDGEEALTILATVRIDLLLLDRNMPRMNGIETLEALRTRRAGPNVFAIMLTAWDSVDAKIEALDRGFDDFLSKNASDQEIVAKINASRRIIARHRALNLENRTLYDLSIRDPLTGLFNRRYFDSTAGAMLANEPEGCVLLVDLDDFKKINDRWGHPMGDAILQGVSEALQRSLRYEDLVARYGGDEFIAFLPRVCRAEGDGVVARVAAAVAELRWTAGNGEIGVGATIGIATSTAESPSDIASLFASCDKDLYRRKSRARSAKRESGEYLRPV